MQYECQICGKRSEQCRPCPDCKALYYCSEEHRKAHLHYGHADECTRMAKQLQRAQELGSIRLPWTRGLTSANVCKFLGEKGCHRKGIWKRECACSQDSSWGSLGPDLHREMPKSFAAAHLAESLILPKSSLPCFASAVQLMDLPAGWEGYYRLRGLDADDSVAAMLMDVPLTLLWVIGLAARMKPDLISFAPGASLLIVCLGVQKELDQWLVLLELACLLPALHLHLVLVSPEVPSGLTGRSAACPAPQAARCGDSTCSCARAPAPQQAMSRQVDAVGSLRITFVRGLYHDVSAQVTQQWGAAHLVIGLNAGLAAYPSWIPTLQQLMRPEAPLCFFTDFCEEAAGRAAGLIRHLGCQGLRVPVQINPFRHPVRVQQPDNALPSYSNAFAFGFSNVQG